MKKRMEHDLGTGDLKYHWAYSLPHEDICFVKYRKGKGRGCPHHISSVAFRCATCQREVGCCYCHQDLFELDEEHAFRTDRVAICTKCKKEHAFDRSYIALDAPYVCDGCYTAMFKTICFDCGHASMIEDFYHCDLCGECVLGKREHYQHCSACNKCIEKEVLNVHLKVCGKEPAVQC